MVGQRDDRRGNLMAGWKVVTKVAALVEKMAMASAVALAVPKVLLVDEWAVVMELSMVARMVTDSGSLMASMWAKNWVDIVWLVPTR